MPGRDNLSDDELLSFVAEKSYTGWHHSGTCKIGSAEDRMAVVDPTLAVYGLKNIRVVDGSVMPTVVSGNTNAACLMIGEKGAYHTAQAAAGH